MLYTCDQMLGMLGTGLLLSRRRAGKEPGILFVLVPSPEPRLSCPRLSRVSIAARGAGMPQCCRQERLEERRSPRDT